MTYYIKVTRDKYELIKEMAYSVQELAELTNTKEKTIFKGLERSSFWTLRTLRA